MFDLSTWLVSALKAADLGAEVGVRRPPDDVNRASSLVRVVVLGGRTDWGGRIWRPIITLECWAADQNAADDLCSDATTALLGLEGDGAPTHFLAHVELVTTGSQAPVDGHPVTITTAILTIELPERNNP